MTEIPGLKPNWKVWLELEGQYVFGAGAYAILRAVQERGTIAEGAASLGMSYRYAWGLIREIEKRLGVKLVKTQRGGSSIIGGVGGGSTVVTDVGLRLMQMYSELDKAIQQIARLRL